MSLMDGLEFLRAIVDGRIPQAPISEVLGFTLVSADPDSVVFEAETGRHLYNPMGTVHGGYFATLLDSALGCAVMSRLPVGMAYATAQLNMNLLRPATEATGKLRVTGTAIHVGRTIGTAEARVVGVRDGKLYAHGSTTCSIFPVRTS